ncbi:Uncharacterised protein [uncultured Clostridium sp.]|nr:Uncharacterised protein [uncultured Clostridium sp.]
MDILKQCQKWHEEDKHQKIVDALEAISAEERTPEMDMELARAYNNLADPSEPEGKKLLHRALELMQSHACDILKKPWNCIPVMIQNSTPNKTLRI